MHTNPAQAQAASPVGRAGPPLWGFRHRRASRLGRPPAARSTAKLEGALTAANFQQDIPQNIYNVSSDEACGPYGWWGEESLDLAAVHGSAPGANILYIGARDCNTSLTIALSDAIKVSCNAFFYQYGNAAGIDSIDAIGTLLGLGRIAHLGLTGEQQGILPTPEWLKLHLNCLWTMRPAGPFRIHFISGRMRLQGRTYCWARHLRRLTARMQCCADRSAS